MLVYRGKPHNMDHDNQVIDYPFSTWENYLVCLKDYMSTEDVLHPVFDEELNRDLAENEEDVNTQIIKKLLSGDEDPLMGFTALVQTLRNARYASEWNLNDFFAPFKYILTQRQIHTVIREECKASNVDFWKSMSNWEDEVYYYYLLANIIISIKNTLDYDTEELFTEFQIGPEYGPGVDWEDVQDHQLKKAPEATRRAVLRYAIANSLALTEQEDA